jgi:DNA-binding NarL/FixJ family response regulator
MRTGKLGELKQDQGVIRVLIVDDHPLVRHGLAQLISDEEDMVVCGEAAGAAEALQQVEEHAPDMAIIDLSLQDGSGIELIEQIRMRARSVRMLVSSMHDETLFAERVLQAGAMGYINKQEATKSVVDAIRQIMKGKIYLSSMMADRMLTQLVDRDHEVEQSPIKRLSNRELQVFELIGRGLATRQVAEHLHLSIKTIETHRESIKRKLNLETAGELTRAAVQWVLEQK